MKSGLKKTETRRHDNKRGMARDRVYKGAIMLSAATFSNIHTSSVIPILYFGCVTDCPVY